MKSLIVLGALLFAVGVCVFILPPSFYIDWQRFTPSHVHARQTLVSIPIWLGSVSIGVGVILMLVGATLHPHRY